MVRKNFVKFNIFNKEEKIKIIRFPLKTNFKLKKPPNKGNKNHKPEKIILDLIPVGQK